MPCLIKLVALAAGFVQRRLGHLASLREGGQKVVHHDTAPFQPKHGQEQPCPLRQHTCVWGIRERASEKAVEMLKRDRYRRLGKEIAYRLCRVVPAGILEIDEYKLAASRNDCIVKAKVGWGDATILRG